MQSKHAFLCEHEISYKTQSTKILVMPNLLSYTMYALMEGESLERLIRFEAGNVSVISTY